MSSLVPRIAMVSTYPPTLCGIARFSSHLTRAIENLGIEVGVVQIARGGEATSPHSAVVGAFDPENIEERSAATQILDEYDVVVIQHEFGLFGADAGRSVIDLAEGITSPVLVVVHTVPRDPTEDQLLVLKALAAEATILAVPSMSARNALMEILGFDAKVIVLTHGSNWSAAPTRHGRRTNIISWGLLGPGKGIERSLHALSALSDLDPLYRVVGRTHPNVERLFGNTYREALEALAIRLGVAVEFVDSYLEEDELHDLVADSDVVLIPYDNRQQISSGVLVDAIAAGRPVVATNFPHARELLGDGAGIVVEHDDSEQMSDALRKLLTDDFAYRRSVEAARVARTKLGWDAVARRYRDLINQLSGASAVG